MQLFLKPKYSLFHVNLQFSFKYFTMLHIPNMEVIMGAVSAAEAAFSGIGLATSLFGRNKSAEAQEQAVQLRLQQEEAANVERSTQRGRRLNEIMASQVAREGASGLSVASPSFFAVGQDSFNQFAEDENADALNLSFDKISAANSQKAIDQQKKFGSMGDVFNAGKSIFNSSVFRKAPQSQPVTQTLQEAPEGNLFPEGQHQSLMGELYSNTNVQDFIL